MLLLDRRGRKAARRSPAWAAVVVLVATSVFGFTAPAHAAYSSTLTSAGWGANSTVYAIAVFGDTVFIGGKFTKLRNPLTGHTVPAAGLAALDRETGQPVENWSASVNGDVRSLAVSNDGKLIAGGGFTTANGAPADHLVALNPYDGSSLPWQASASGTVRDIVVSGSSVYVGGAFSRVNGVARGGLAQLDAITGAVLPWKSSTSGGRPWALEISPDGQDLTVGGNFTGLGGAPRQFLGAVSRTTGQATTWTPQATCDTCFVFDIDADASTSYVALGGPGGQVKAYAGATGTQTWSKGTNGNVQAVTVSGDLVYAGGHFDGNFAGSGDSNPRHQLAALSASNGALDPFAPEMIKPNPGVWALVATPDALFAGGGFTGVGSVPQLRYAQFATQP